MILDMDTLLAARRARGMTQGNVARATGISVPTLRALERGEGGLGPLVAIMGVLGLRWGWVPHGEDAAGALAGRRKARGISQAELARRIGCSRPTLIASMPSGTRTETSISAGSEGWSLAGNHQAELSG